MKKTILEVYAMAVCFGAIICFVITLGIGIYDIIEIAYPEFTLRSYDLTRHQTNDAYWASIRNRSDKPGTPRPSEEALTKERLESYRWAIVSERRDGLQSLTRCIIILLINSFIFTIHWIIARRARESIATV
jgi:hypothetical protein